EARPRPEAPPVTTALMLESIFMLVFSCSIVETHEPYRLVHGLAARDDGIGGEDLVRPAHGDAGLDHLVVRDAGFGAYHRRLHDALAVDDAAESPGPRRVDQAVHHAAAVEGRDVAAMDRAVVGDDDRDRRIE